MRENLYLRIFKILIKKIYILIFLFFFIAIIFLIYSDSFSAVIKNQVKFAPNNISTFILNTGIFNQDIRTNNTPGFEWPKGSGKFALFTSGLSIGAYVNGFLRMGNASYNGEYAPGYVGDSNGIPVFRTDSRFRLYSVRYNDNQYTNPDVIAWKDMVPFGAPFSDLNNNKIYDIGIDKPGVPDATQTVFFCYTDADYSNHTTSEGFSGGTKPLNAELRLTAWGYDDDVFNNVQFFKWTIINKNDSVWNKTHFGIVTDPDLGETSDDFVGCDTNLKLTYCYNATNQDGTGSYRSYGANPPAVGQLLLRGAIKKAGYSIDSICLSSSINLYKNYPWCEAMPSYPVQSYNFLHGVKNEGTPYLNPISYPYNITKYTLTGNPEDSTGWTERFGWIHNCGGALYGEIEASPPGDRRFMFSSGSDLLNVAPGDTQKIVIAQLIARGTNNLNSVTKLKELALKVRQIYYLIENDAEPVNEPITILPPKYVLHQNYPNPFNPVTTIKYETKMLWKVKIQVYDSKGELIKTLVNEEKPQGVYEVQFDATNLPSGIYFIKMVSGGGFESSKKMVVIK